MNLTFLIMTAAAGIIATPPVMAQQSQGKTVLPNQEETVPLQLKVEQIMNMQQKLNAQGFSAGNVDGLWGPNTSAALMRFQKRNGLQPTGKLDQKVLVALGIGGALAASPAPAPQDATALATNNPPGMAAGTAMGRTMDTNVTGTNPGGADTGTNAAGGNANQAVATTSANALQPARGANSFSMGEARRRIASRGFQNVDGLRKDDGSIWRGMASKDGQQVNVWLDYKGNIGQQ